MLDCIFTFHSDGFNNEPKGSFEIYLSINPVWQDRSYEILRVWHIEDGLNVSIDIFTEKQMVKIHKECIKWAKKTIKDWRDAETEDSADKRRNTMVKAGRWSK